MQKEKYISWIKEEEPVSKKQIQVLDEIITVFPYFQSARVLQLKGLKKYNSLLYNKALKITASYTTNRNILFDYITSNVFDYELKDKEEKDFINKIEVIDLKSIPFESNPVSNTKSKSDLSPKKERENIKIKEKLKIGEPLKFTTKDAYSFNEWLQIGEKKKINRVKEPKVESKKSQKKLNIENKKLQLIEKFLQSKPKIKPVKNTESIDISRDSTVYNTNLMTETLAKVYIEQKKYDKAIQAFRILSLKYPEKSSFFANQIKAIEFLKKT